MGKKFLNRLPDIAGRQLPPPPEPRRQREPDPQPARAHPVGHLGRPAGLGRRPDGKQAQDPAHLRHTHLHQAHKVPLLQQDARGGVQAGTGAHVDNIMVYIQ